MIHESCVEWGCVLQEQLQELARMLTKRYNVSFPTKFFDKPRRNLLDDYRRSFNQEESLKMGQPKERFGDRDLFDVVEEFNKIR